VTVKEVILDYSGLSDVTDNFTEKVMADREVTGSATYSSSNKTEVALCAADLYMMQVTSPDFSEGKFSMKMSRGAMIRAAQILYRENGEGTKADSMAPGAGKAKTSWW
jgi:hypothetical protein